MLSELSNHDDTVHFKNDPLDPPNIFSENHDECDIVSDSKKKKTGGKKLKSKFTLALSALSIKAQPISASKKDTNNVNLDASYEKMVEKSTKIIDVKKKRYPENNKNDVVSSSDNLSDTFQEVKVESLLKNLVNRSEKLKGLTANTTLI